MKYTVITASLNSGKTIKRTIESVFYQTILPEKYIFVDGGSTDNTLAIIKESIDSAKSNNLPIDFEIIFQTTKGGIYQAWNMALQLVKSDIICILNSDDWYRTETMAYVVSELKNENIDILLGAGLYLRSNDEKSKEIRYSRSFITLPILLPIIHPACFVKKRVYDKIGGFNDKYISAGDYDFIYRCYKYGIRFKRTKKILVNIEKGGFAENHRPISRIEVAEIGSHFYALKLIPKLAYWVRLILKR